MQKYFIHINIVFLLLQSFCFFFIYSYFYCHGLDDIYTHKGYVFIVLIGILLYFLPTFISSKMNKKYFLQIFLLNLFLGFTFLGWLGALIWATFKTENNENYNKISTIILQIISAICFTAFCITDFNLYNYDTVKQKNNAAMQILLDYATKKD